MLQAASLGILQEGGDEQGEAGVGASHPPELPSVGREQPLQVIGDDGQRLAARPCRLAVRQKGQEALHGGRGCTEAQTERKRGMLTPERR